MHEREKCWFFVKINIFREKLEKQSNSKIIEFDRFPCFSREMLIFIEKHHFSRSCTQDFTSKNGQHDGSRSSGSRDLKKKTVQGGVAVQASIRSLVLCGGEMATKENEPAPSQL